MKKSHITINLLNKDQITGYWEMSLPIARVQLIKHTSIEFQKPESTYEVRTPENVVWEITKEEYERLQSILT